MWFSKKINPSGALEWQCKLLGLILALNLAAGICKTGLADDASDEKPVVLLVFQEASGLSDIENALYKDLSLNIETHQIAVKTGFQFTKSTIPEQIDEIRNLQPTQNCDAAIWLFPRDGQMVTLQLAVWAPGQFTIRSLDASIETGEIGELAIAVRELLADIQIPVKSAGAIKTEETPPAVSQMPVDAPANAPPPARQSRFFGVLDGGVERGFANGPLSPIFVEGQLGLGWSHPNGMQLSVHLGAKGALPEEDSDVRLTVRGPGAIFQLAYLWRNRLVQAGPLLGAQIQYQRATMRFGEAGEQEKTWWTPGVIAGLMLRFPVDASVQIQIRSLLNMNLSQTIFKKKSTESLIYETPRVSGSLMAGVVIGF